MSSLLQRLLLLTCLVVGFSGDLLGQNKDLDIKLVAERVVQANDGKESFESGDKAKPGETIRYTAVYKNQTKSSIAGLRLNLPIPAGTEYVSGSAKPAPGLASLDGKTFEPIPIKRKVKSSEGKETEQEVPSSQYRALGWMVELPAGKEVTVLARAKILSSQSASPK